MIKMKKLLMAVALFTTIGMYGQLSTTRVDRIFNNTTPFTDFTSRGNIVIDLTAWKAYLIKLAQDGDTTLSNIVDGTDFMEFVFTDQLHDSVTLSGAADYLTQISQDIVQSLIDTTSTNINRANWLTFIDNNSGACDDLIFSTGLTRSVNTVTSDLSTGVDGGQSVIGGIEVGDDLTISSTTNATKGSIFFGTSAYDEVNDRLGINIISPVKMLDIIETTSDVAGEMRIGGILAGDDLPFGRVNFANMAAANLQPDKILAYISGDKNGSSNKGMLTFATSDNAPPTKKMWIMPTGNVGIGVAIPDEKLEVNGGILADTIFTNITASLENAANYMVGGDSIKAYVDRNAGTASGWTLDADTLYSAFDSTVVIKDGNLGINNPDPIYPIHYIGHTTSMPTQLIGSFNTQSFSDVNGFMFVNSYFNGGDIRLLEDGRTAGFQFSNGAIFFRTEEASGTAGDAVDMDIKMTLSKEGDFGIGVTPTSKLDVNGTATMTGFKLPTGATNDYVLTSDGSGTGTWQPPSTTDYWTLDVDTLSTGNYILGVNETAPDADKGGLTLNQGAADGFIFTGKSSDVAHLFTDFAEADTWGGLKKANTANGGIGIDGFTETIPAVIISGYAGAAGQTESGSSLGIISLVSYKTDGGTGVTSFADDDNITVMKNNFSTKFILKGNGDLYIDGSYLTYSDNRLKKNQKPLSYGLAELMKLKPKSYTRFSGSVENGKVKLEKNSQRKEIGLVAQEVLDIIPEAVNEPTDEANSFYGMDYNKLIPVMIKAIQEQQEQIDELKKAVSDLKKDNTELSNIQCDIQPKWGLSSGAYTIINYNEWQRCLRNNLKEIKKLNGKRNGFTDAFKEADKAFDKEFLN